MVELFPAWFPRTPKLVIAPRPCVSTRPVPTLATLHRPPLAESGPVDGIGNTQMCSAPALPTTAFCELSSHKVFQSRPFSCWVSDRTVRLLGPVIASRRKKQHPSGLVHRASVELDKQVSPHPALRARQHESSDALSFSVVGKATFPRSYLLSKKSLCKLLQTATFSYGGRDGKCDTLTENKSHARVARHNRRNI